jgi:acetylornithine deacetylase/succinyl-diaminopimelate desuccinylase-like protein
VTDADTIAGTLDVAIPDQVHSLMPELKEDLIRLSRIPSIAFAGFPREPLIEAHDLVAELLGDAGATVETLSLPGTAPVVIGGIPAPEGAPTVLLYGHYDVVPGGDESLWNSPPFEPVERDGAIFGRGTSDSKANIIVHVGALRAWNGRPPVGIKLVIEGEEEIGGGAFGTYPQSNPDLFAADAMLIADMGSVRPGVPTLTVALRGTGVVTLEATTLGAAKHSGQYGGAAPDALLVVLHALASLHDAKGDVAVEGLRRDEWSGDSYSDDEFRELADVEGNLPLIGSGGLGSRIWSGPAITVIGIDVAPVDEALNAVVPNARAKLNIRVHPEQDAAEAQQAVIRHLESLKPFGIPLTVHAGTTGNGFATGSGGPAYKAAIAAKTAAWGVAPLIMASGGSIPLVSALQEAVPEAEILLLGATDGHSNIHAPDERVLLDELEKAIVAEADFFGLLAAQ